MAAAAPPPTTHYEVVDDRDAVLGSMKHTTVEQALAMKTAFGDHFGDMPMHVAKVTETLVVRRHVERIVETPAKIMRVARKQAA